MESDCLKAKFFELPFLFKKIIFDGNFLKLFLHKISLRTTNKIKGIKYDKMPLKFKQANYQKKYYKNNLLSFKKYFGTFSC